jgi:hypothetical protein
VGRDKEAELMEFSGRVCDEVFRLVCPEVGGQKITQSQRVIGRIHD